VETRTMSDGDPYKFKTRIKTLLNRIKTNPEMEQAKKEQIKEFYRYLQMEDLSNPRIHRHLSCINLLMIHMDFNITNPDKKDILELVRKINNSTVGTIDKLAPSTKAEYKKTLKKFYKDYLNTVKEDINGRELVNFFNTKGKAGSVDYKNLLKPRHIKKLIAKPDRIRDKAFLMTLWTTAGRIGEILGLKWKDVFFEKDMAKIRFRETKTGDSRTVPIHVGFLYLKELKEKDHKGDDPEAFLFRSMQSDEQLSYSGSSNIIKRARKKTDIPSRIKTNPHSWRKARATYLSTQGMNQQQIAKYGGWVQGSDKLATYIRLGKANVEAGVRQLSGLEANDTEPEPDLKPTKCYNCGKFNKFEADNCSNCGTVLKTSKAFTDLKVRETKEELKNTIIKENIGMDEQKIREKAKELVKNNIRT